MEANPRRCMPAYLGLVVVILFVHSDARTTLLSNHVSVSRSQNMKHITILEVAKNLNMLTDVSYDSLAPTSAPPYCVYPPPNPLSPVLPGPISYSPTLSPPPDLLSSPPPDEVLSSPPNILPGPPEILSSPPIILPSPPIMGSGPPDSFNPSPFTPPYYEPSPPSLGNIPGPPSISFEPSPPVFEPPVVYPPPTAPPSPVSSGGSRGPGVWCVAKPSVPDPIIQEAMNYACGSGADCDPIQPNGQCFSPNTLLAHASFAFNSYWQRTKVAGGSCSFGGTAILVTVDPSSQGCRFDNV